MKTTFKSIEKKLRRKIENNDLRMLAFLPVTKNYAFLCRSSRIKNGSEISCWLVHLTCRKNPLAGVSIDDVHARKCNRCLRKPSSRTIEKAKFLKGLMKI